MRASGIGLGLAGAVSGRDAGVLADVEQDALIKAQQDLTAMGGKCCARF